jgi:hypothetical protein
MDPTDREQACFEAGIKFGALYHQFVGAPVSPDSASSLARAMEESIENQPHCREVSVDVKADRIRQRVQKGYTELTGTLMDVDVAVERAGVEVRASMAEDEAGYPLMAVNDVSDRS